MKKEIPVLFSFPMVLAIMDGRKTMTRRPQSLQVINENPEDWQFEWAEPRRNIWTFTQKSSLNAFSLAERTFNQVQHKCPYGTPDDILYVREAHFRYGKWVKNGTTKTGKQKWAFKPSGQFDNFRYQENKPAKVQKNSDRITGWYKRPSLFMPKVYARLWLQVSDIRVERLQDITEADAKAEGIEWYLYSGKSSYYAYKDYLNRIPKSENDILNATESFQSLWLSINGKESWVQNPWVWVISFKVLSTTGKPNL